MAEDLHRKQLYDRQSYVIGAETQAKYEATDVLIVGLTGLGCEIAKNLVLTGVRSIGILDNSPILLEDLSTNFLASEADVGKQRTLVVVPKLAEMNRYVSVHSVGGSVTKELLSQFHVVIFVDQATTCLTAENEWARSQGVKFVACESRGISGCVFVDGGDKHHISDVSGEETTSSIITGIGKDGSIFCHEDKKHECEPGSHVYITGVISPQFLNSNSSSGAHTLFRVKDVVGPFGLKIDCPDLALVDDIQVGTSAYLHTTKTSKDASFRPLKECVVNPSFNFIIDEDEKLMAASQLHDIYRNVHCGNSSVGSDIDEKFAQAVIDSFYGQFNPMSCFIGGLASQEALKLTSGKFTPLDQWFYYDVRELIPLMGDRPNRSPMASRNDGQIRAIGRELNSKIQATRAFIVGAGALGCEHIKNAAVMGFRKVTITDMDTIEISNLSRQFLFRNWHVGKPKSRVAAEAALVINPNMQVEVYEEKVCRDTESIFDETFWNSQDVILNALDNVPARLYVDEQCVFYKKPLFESGTLGTKCNMQVVIPHITESYGSSADPPEKSIPLCTLKHFPNAIEHTIQWARDWFHQLVTSTPTDVKRYLENPSVFLQSLESDQSNKPLVLKAIANTLRTWPSSPEDCIRLARLRFEELFNHDILQLLHNFPVDRINENGQPFWSGARKPPSPIVFDPADQMHVAFIYHCSALIADVFGIPFPQVMDLQFIGQVSTSVEVPPFEPAAVTFVVEGEKVTSTQSHGPVQLPDAERSATQIFPVEFDKDNDQNHHIDFISAASNLRARNYSIPVVERSKTKLIAGNIIPAMVTTTSLVTGLVNFEVAKYVGGLTTRSAYRNAFVNIALPLIVFSDPAPVNAREYRKPSGSIVRWTMWDRIDIDSNNITVKQLVSEISRSQELEVFMVALPSGKMIYSQFGAKKADLDRLVRDVARERGADIGERTSHLMLVVSGTFGDEDVDVPNVRCRI